MKVDRTSLNTPELQALTKFEDLLYVFFLCDLSKENPLRDIPYNKKAQEARLRAYGPDFKTLSPEVEVAIATYPQTEEQKDIFTYDKKMDQFNTLLKETEPKIQRNENENTGVVSFTTNIDIINHTLKDIINIIQAKASLVALYTTGSIPRHLRGGLSPLAKGKIK